jgi:hypothetical protein
MKLAIAKYGGLRVAQEESQVVVVGLLLVEVGNQRSPVKCQISHVHVSIGLYLSRCKRKYCEIQERKARLCRHKACRTLLGGSRVSLPFASAPLSRGYWRWFRSCALLWAHAGTCQPDDARRSLLATLAFRARMSSRLWRHFRRGREGQQLRACLQA